ncbi:hypothetical protein BC826DRAFT_967380 [Russula brevipes]|nr:hypothetical protein BC826DRAFT_967380 [Russula brevipes]
MEKAKLRVWREMPASGACGTQTNIPGPMGGFSTKPSADVGLRVRDTCMISIESSIDPCCALVVVVRSGLLHIEIRIRPHNTENKNHELMPAEHSVYALCMAIGKPRVRLKYLFGPPYNGREMHFIAIRIALFKAMNEDRISAGVQYEQMSREDGPVLMRDRL